MVEVLKPRCLDADLELWRVLADGEASAGDRVLPMILDLADRLHRGRRVLVDQCRDEARSGARARHLAGPASAAGGGVGSAAAAGSSSTRSRRPVSATG